MNCFSLHQENTTQTLITLIKIITKTQKFTWLLLFYFSDYQNDYLPRYIV